MQARTADINQRVASSASYASSSSLLQDPAGQFARNYNRKSFMFPHGLATHPLFELDQLVELALRIPDHRDTYWSNGRVGVQQGWDAGTKERLSLRETMEGIEHNNSMVILKHTEQDPVFGPVLQEFLQAVIDHAGETMRQDVVVGETLIMMSSPNRVTPYHIDAETNFLVQVRGDKTFYVFNQDDRTLVSNEEAEAFFCAEMSAARYRPERQQEAIAYDLRAGYGVHVPTAAPHWVTNGNNVSIAISVNYELRSVHQLSRLHRMNRKLRSLGISPAPPGISPWRDRVKLLSANGLARARSLFVPSSPQLFRVWRPNR